RYDKFRVKWYDDMGARRPFEQSEGVWSGRLGVVYKPVRNGSIYLSYSQASQPSAADAASRTGTGHEDGNAAHYSPGKAKTWELGTKWDVLDDKLAFTAAVFQVERSNPSDTNPDNPSQTIQSSAKERVRGVELGVAGNVTSKWSVYGGWTLLRSKILENQEDPAQVGGKMKNVPDMTFNLWTNYEFDHRWDAGLGAQYIGKRRFAAGNTVARNASADVYMPSFWLFNAAVGYKVNKNFALRLNVNNVFDKFYLQRGSASSDGFQLFGIPGAGRTVMLSADARF
ncbi:MAG TPA: TonB-dependent receptor, partial [Spongiibacteraceae bacterium]|nr:TonB-dependent receptor [Spongiibacteraceae bacterium]